MKGKHNRALRETRARRNGGNSGAASGADQVVESRGAFQERPAWERWRGHRQCSTKTPREDLGPSPRRTVAGPVQRPALGGQVTTATPFAPRGSWPRSATGAASRRPTRHSVNALACEASEVGVDCGWQTSARDALLRSFNFPTVTSSEAARGVDRGKCGLRSLPGFWERGGREQRSAPCLAGCALDRPLSDETVVRHAGLPAGLRRRARSRL